jgi:sulfatase maturation enzyme AslB (radical SAM superfamily)
MCSNWQRGDRKADMTLEQIDRVFQNPLWKNIEMCMLSGGEPTTRNDMVEVSQVFLDRLPKLRKYGINTTGLTPHRAIPMITKVAEACHEKGIIFSTRVSIDGVGEMHNEVRQVKNGFAKATETIKALREAQKRVPFNFGVSATIFNKNIDDCENILAWSKKEGLDIVFNMVRFSDPMLGNADLGNTVKPIGRDEERLRKFFLERVRMDPLMDGQNYIHMHYADMIGNGYHREAPCPFQTQGIMLNPDGGLFFCENSEVVGNVLTEDPEELYFRVTSQKHREWIRDTQCPTCLSPCQMNVAAVKQVVPYIKFLVRASREKRRGAAANIAAAAGSVSD